LSASEHVYRLRDIYDIASVNISLGGGRFTSTCDSDDTLITNVTGRLKGVGIATVVASGNDGFTDSISAPTCITNAIAIGATADFDGSLGSSTVTKGQRVFYSNSSPALDLYAPGSLILSSVPGNAFANFNGTSMATPHVVGAFAVIRQGKSNASVAEIESALKSVGPKVGIAGALRRGLDITAALEVLGISNAAVMAPILPILLDD